MKRFANERGFTVVEVVIVLLIVLLLAGSSYMMLKRRSDNTAATTTNTASGAVDDKNVPSAPEVKTTKDLDTSTEALDDAELESSDTDALDTQTDGF